MIHHHHSINNLDKRNCVIGYWQRPSWLFDAKYHTYIICLQWKLRLLFIILEKVLDVCSWEERKKALGQIKYIEEYITEMCYLKRGEFWSHQNFKDYTVCWFFSIILATLPQINKFMRFKIVWICQFHFQFNHRTERNLDGVWFDQSFCTAILSRVYFIPSCR